MPETGFSDHDAFAPCLPALTIIYIVGLIVVIGFILGFFGLR